MKLIIKLSRTLSTDSNRWLYILLSSLAFINLPTTAQVNNNNIGNRQELILDSPSIFSTTNNHSVEWECVNKALTNKCLAYHNDQWFKFSVDIPGNYFINLIAKDCKKRQGIQAIVIEGNPCEPRTYKILKCLPQIRDHDVFIALDSLQSNIDYLVNIDGFLGDYCSFEIQLSSSPKGLSADAVSQEIIQMSTDIRKNLVHINWSITESIAEDHTNFDVIKNHNGIRTLIESKPIEWTTAGKPKLMYSSIDTVRHLGIFKYEIVGSLKNGVRQILRQDTIKFLNGLSLSQRKKIDLLLNFKNGREIQMILLDKLNDRVLTQSSFTFDGKVDRKQQIDVTKYLDLGITSFIVRTIDLRTKQRNDYEFNFDNTD